MKKMSEVFALPISGENYKLTSNEGHVLSDFNFKLEAQHAAHAINHVDALVDALEAVIEMAWLISEDLTDEFSARPEIVTAKKALAAYRGEK